MDEIYREKIGNHKYAFRKSKTQIYKTNFGNKLFFKKLLQIAVGFQKLFGLPRNHSTSS